MHITTETESCGVVMFPLIPPTSITHCGESMEAPLLIAVLPDALLDSDRSEPVPLACAELRAWERDLLAVREQVL